MFPVRLTLALCVCCLGLSGCAMNSTATSPTGHGLALRGNVHGGQQPIVGAQLYLLQANTTGYGNASISLLQASATGNSDSLGAYVLTGSDGSFDISSDYTCTPGTQVYLYGRGGNPGAGVNTGAALMLALGSCPSSDTFANSVPYLTVNEVTTVAAAYAFAGFATDATHVSSSGTAAAKLGIANAFANAGNLADIGSGSPLTTTPAGNGTAPAATVSTLANILAACINSTGSNSSACNTLFSNAIYGPYGIYSTDTATAAIYIAHNPGNNVAALYGLQSATAPFQPALTGQPNDFSVGINYSGGGLNAPYSVAIDSFGNAWTANTNAGSVSEFSPLGAALSGDNGFSGGGIFFPNVLSIDANNNIWVANGVGSVSELANNGTPISSDNAYTGGGIAGSATQAVALDGFGNAWVGGYNNYPMSFLTELNSSGVASPASPITGSGLNLPSAIAIDAQENVWVANRQGNSVSKFSNAGVSVAGNNGLVGTGASPAAIAINSSAAAMTANADGNSVTQFDKNGNLTYTVTGGGLSSPSGIATDGLSQSWISNGNNSSVTQITSGGTVLSPAGGFTGGSQGSPQGIAVDGSGNVWVAGSLTNTMTELIGIAAPVVTPLALGVKNNTVSLRP